MLFMLFGGVQCHRSCWQSCTCGGLPGASSCQELSEEVHVMVTRTVIRTDTYRQLVWMVSLSSEKSVAFVSLTVSCTCPSTNSWDHCKTQTQNHNLLEFAIGVCRITPVKALSLYGFCVHTVVCFTRSIILFPIIIRDRTVLIMMCCKDSANSGSSI